MKKKKPLIEIIFQTTASGKHVIEMGELGRLVFADMTKHSVFGYKHITYSRTYMDIVSVKRAGVRKQLEVPTRDSYVFNLKMKRDEEGKKGVPRGTIPQKITSWFITHFDKFSVDGFFPEKNIPKLAKKIKKTNFNELKVKKKSKPRRKKKVAKKPDPVKVKDRVAAEDILRRSLNGKNGFKKRK